MKLLASLLLLALVAVRPASGAEGEEPFFQALDGRTVHASDLRGGIVLLNFWATWCGPCQSEMPVFVKLHDELGAKGLRIVGAAANGPSDAEAVKAFVKQAGMRFDVWLWVSAGDMRYYGVGPGIPATLVLDRKGVVRARFQGVVTEEKLRPLLVDLLAKP